jgi:hypothetical protein
MTRAFSRGKPVSTWPEIALYGGTDVKGISMSARPQTKDKPAPVNFLWDDPFLLDEQLTEDERMIRDTARAYAQDKLLPRVTKA